MHLLQPNMGARVNAETFTVQLISGLCSKHLVQMYPGTNKKFVIYNTEFCLLKTGTKKRKDIILSQNNW